MKKLMLVFSVVLQMVVIQSFATGSLVEGTSSSLYNKSNQEDREKITREELPEAARKTLDSDTYKGWAFVNAYKTKLGEYEVELKKGDGVQTLKFDKDGKVK